MRHGINYLKHASSDHLVTMTDIVRYAGAAGDFTPIHHDPEIARKSGYEQVFAMGMLVAGYLGSLVEQEFGSDNIVRISFRFLDKTWVNELVICRIFVVQEMVDQVFLELRLLATQTGREVVSGSATIRINHEDEERSV